MFGFWFSRMTRISLMMSSFLGCWDRFMVLMATSLPVATSMAMYTVPDALQHRGRKQCTPWFSDWSVASYFRARRALMSARYLHLYIIIIIICEHCSARMLFQTNHHACFEPKSISASGWNRYCKPWQTDRWYSPGIWQRTWSQKWYVEWPHRSSRTVNVYSKVEVSR